MRQQPKADQARERGHVHVAALVMLLITGGVLSLAVWGLIGSAKQNPAFTNAASIVDKELKRDTERLKSLPVDDETRKALEAEIAAKKVTLKELGQTAPTWSAVAGPVIQAALPLFIAALVILATVAILGVKRTASFLDVALTPAKVPLGIGKLSTQASESESQRDESISRAPDRTLGPFQSAVTAIEDAVRSLYKQIARVPETSAAAIESELSRPSVSSGVLFLSLLFGIAQLGVGLVEAQLTHWVRSTTGAAELWELWPPLMYAQTIMLIPTALFLGRFGPSIITRTCRKLCNDEGEYVQAVRKSGWAAVLLAGLVSIVMISPAMFQATSTKAWDVPLVYSPGWSIPQYVWLTATRILIFPAAAWVGSRFAKAERLRSKCVPISSILCPLSAR